MWAARLLHGMPMDSLVMLLDPNPLSNVSGYPLPKLLLIVRYIVVYQYIIGLGRGCVKTCEYTISSYEETRLSSMCYCFYMDNNNDFIAIFRCLLDHCLLSGPRHVPLEYAPAPACTVCHRSTCRECTWAWNTAAAVN